MWRDKDKTRLFKQYSNVTYDYKGTIYCHCPFTNAEREMVNGGFEKDRDTLKKLCPAKQYGITCEGALECPVKQGIRDRKSTRLNSSHVTISYAVFCLK